MRNIILKPEIKMSDDQVAISKIDCPISGWVNSRKVIIVNKIKETICDKFKLLILFDVII